MATNPISQEEYLKEFSGDKRAKALEQALDIRKFEIELYWKRATYFWTFIAAALAGFGAIQVSTSDVKTDLSVVLSCLGIVFSIGWLCVNRGSKHWQENWENHVDMLENDVVGPLYKIVLTRVKPANNKEWFVHAITGPSQLSVSKVNQIISIYVAGLWIALLIYSLPPFDSTATINLFYMGLIVFTTITCLAFFGIGTTWKGGYKHFATKRTAHIDNES